MTDKKVEVRLSADSRGFSQALSQAGQQIKAFSTSTVGTMSRVKGAFERATANIGIFGRAMTALSSGYILKKMFSVTDFMPIDTALLRMQANLKMSALELDGFKTQLAALSAKEGKDLGEVFKGAAGLSINYKPDDIMKIMRASTMLADVTGDQLSVATDRVKQIMRIYHKAPEDAQEIAQSIIASRTDLESLDMLLQRGILKGGIGKDYKDALTILGGLVKSGIDNSRVIMTMEGAMTSLFKKTKQLKGIGIDPFKINKATGKKVKKDTIEILEELQKLFKTKYKRFSDDELATGLDQLLGPGAGEGIIFLISQLENLKKARTDQGAASVIAAELAAKADQSWEKQLGKIKESIATIKTDLSWIYDLAKEPIKLFADSPAATKGVAYTAAGASVAVLGATVYGVLKTIFAASGKNGLPVYVTNISGGTGPLSGGTDPFKVGSNYGSAGFLSTLWPGLRTLFNNAGPAFAASVIAQPYWEEYQDNVRAAHMRKYMPTADDRAVGSRVFGKSSSWGVGMSSPPINNITIHLQVADGKVTSKTDDLNTHVKFNRGSFAFGDH
jgi:hypothetical protein